MRQLGIRNSTGAATAVLPAAVAGSIALLLSASPATAAVQPERESRTARTPSFALGAVVVAPRVATVVQVPATYTVKQGDTVFGIAMRYGLRTADVLAINGLTSSSIIQPGQVLKLKGGAPAPSPKPAAPSGTYTVQNGDTLSAIAGRHGVSVQALFSANGLGWASIIYPGQKITIPGKGSGQAATSAPAAPAAPATPAPAPAAKTYTIAQGDTLTAIAKKHRVTVQALFAANGLGWASIIYPGQKIAIPGKASAPKPASSKTPVQEPVPALDAEQVGNVQLIIRIGRELGVPDRGIAIALGAAMQESWLRNLDWGDRDSLGLFQQRPSAGWGTKKQVMDAGYATRAFYTGVDGADGPVTRGLLDIPGWQKLSFTQAAQAVQISAYPDRYARWELAATTWLATYG